VAACDAVFNKVYWTQGCDLVLQSTHRGFARDSRMAAPLGGSSACHQGPTGRAESYYFRAPAPLCCTLTLLLSTPQAPVYMQCRVCSRPQGGTPSGAGPSCPGRTGRAQPASPPRSPCGLHVAGGLLCPRGAHAGRLSMHSRACRPPGLLNAACRQRPMHPVSGWRRCFAKHNRRTCL